MECFFFCFGVVKNNGLNKWGGKNGIRAGQDTFWVKKSTFCIIGGFGYFCSLAPGSPRVGASLLPGMGGGGEPAASSKPAEIFWTAPPWGSLSNAFRLTKVFSLAKTCCWCFIAIMERVWAWSNQGFGIFGKKLGTKSASPTSVFLVPGIVPPHTWI